LHAFRDRGMVTFGFDSTEPEAWEGTWKNILENEGKSRFSVDSGAC